MANMLEMQAQAIKIAQQYRNNVAPNVWWIMHLIKCESLRLVIGLSISGEVDSQQSCEKNDEGHLV